MPVLDSTVAKAAAESPAISTWFNYLDSAARPCLSTSSRIVPEIAQESINLDQGTDGDTIRWGTPVRWLGLANFNQHLSDHGTGMSSETSVFCGIPLVVNGATVPPDGIGRPAGAFDPVPCQICRPSVPTMATIELSDGELRLVRNALHSFLSDFGHDESEQVHEIQRLLAKIARSEQQQATA